MNRKRVSVSRLSIAVVFLFAAPWPAKAQDAKTPYPAMAPFEQYLMPDRNQEIKLARSAAPDSISGDAWAMNGENAAVVISAMAKWQVFMLVFLDG